MKKSSHIVFLLLSCCSLFGQVQIGTDILGENPNDDFGSGVAISEDGTIVAIGAHRRNNQQGIVEVYKIVNGQWELMGSKIEGPSDNSWFGTSVALTPMGDRLIVGSYHWNIAMIYDFVGNDWSLNGEIALGNPSSVISFGHAVDISYDGSTVAISATHHPQSHIHRGIVNIYKEINNQWIQLGDGIVGEADKDQSGWDIDLTQNGNTIAISSISNSTNGDDSGQVRIFTYDGNTWNQKANSLYGASQHVSFGWKIDMSEDGRYLVVGAPIDWTGTETIYHYAEVFEFANGNWIPKGERIYGLKDQNFGYDVAISNDGNRIAVSVPQSSDCPIQIFDFKDTHWELVGSISHEAEYSTLGVSIAMNPSGGTLIGTSRTPEGFAVIYALDELNQPECLIEVPENEEEEGDSILIYFPNIVNLNSNNDVNAIFFGQSVMNLPYSIEVFDRWGNLVFKNTQATTNNMADGWSPENNAIQGVFAYIVRYNNGVKEVVLSGDITIIK